MNDQNSYEFRMTLNKFLKNNNFSNMKDLNNHIFEWVLREFSKDNEHLIFENVVNRGMVFKKINLILKIYLSSSEKLGYFEKVKEDKNYISKLKSIRKNLGEDKYVISFQNILNGTFKERNLIIVLKSSCPIETVYDSLKRNKTYKIPFDTELKFLNMIETFINDNNETSYKEIYKFGEEIDQNKTSLNKDLS